MNIAGKTGASKGQTLRRVAPELTLFRVPELLIFGAEEFRQAPDAALDRIAATFGGHAVVVRSSAADEDGEHAARAGEYASVLDICSTDRNALRAGVDTVIASYARNGSGRSGDEVICQKMVANTTMSGVVFTHDLNTGAPYYVINYDDVSGLTNTVTSGGCEYANRTLCVHRGASDAIRSERFRVLLQAVQELERAMASQFLDIEFALDRDLTPYLLQVRAITTQPNWNRAVARRIDATLQGIQDYVRARLGPMAGVYGGSTALGQMPDWNPAEMIGRAPRALAFSLYKTLITDHAWRIAREQMGYNVPQGQPLMVSLAGQPFIDTRLSFNSFLPGGISDAIGGALVDAWVQRLKAAPALHDKVEFEVAITTYSFDIDEKIETLIGDALTAGQKSQFKEALRRQTRKLLLDEGEGGIASAMARVEALARLDRQHWRPAAANNITALFEMIDKCIRLGTIPFSILARHGFIARTILLSLQRRGILDAGEVQSIQSGVRTVASTLVNDMRRLQSGDMSRPAFMAEYGHLRPGTYDILSQRYDQMAEFGRADSGPRAIDDQDEFALSPAKKKLIDRLLIDEDFSELDADRLIAYVHAATAGREYGKFVFTRTISDMLELIAAFGEQNGLSRDEMSHVPIDELLAVLNGSREGSIEERLRRISEAEAEHHVISSAIRLPQLLFDEAGVHVIPFQVSQPNFVTHKKITADCVHLPAGKAPPPLTGKIVLIESADPGFDWIFSQAIGGLITKYGGANSHMAIRCAEFGIPAAIGCGEQRFEVFTNASQILLDCASGLIMPLH